MNQKWNALNIDGGKCKLLASVPQRNKGLIDEIRSWALRSYSSEHQP
jgi:hypothetical protein